MIDALRHTNVKQMTKSRRNVQDNSRPPSDEDSDESDSKPNERGRLVGTAST